MNWKWEDKVDNQRERQREYEARKKAESSKAKSVDDLKRIERSLGPNDFKLDAMKRTAIEEMERRALAELHSQQSDMLRQYMSYSMPSMFGRWGMDEAAKPEPKKPLPEDHIVAAVTGYRAWNVPLFVDELRSVAKASKWKPYQRFEAVCEQSQCSGVACSCGIYAFNKMNLVQTEYTTSDRSKRYVYGECWLWGRVLECKDGYRAQFAYPKALVDNGAIAERMAEIFGVALLTNSKRDGG